MIDNSDVNALLHEAISAGEPFVLFNNFSALIQKHMGGQFPYRIIHVRTPFTCVGVREVKYRYSPSKGLTEIFVRQYIRSILGQAVTPYITSGTLGVLSSDLEHFLNVEWPFTLRPDDYDALAKTVYAFCNSSRLVNRVIRDTKESPANIKINFFKTIVDMMTRFMKVFSK